MKPNMPKMEPLNEISSSFKLDAQTRLSLFGHEDAGQEDSTRLKKYYLKRTDYETVSSEVPLCIVIGFKGVGKSATLKYSYDEDNAKGVPAIWIRPDDVSEIYSQLNSATDVLNLITLWKKGLSRLIACKICDDWNFTISQDAEHVINWAESSGYRSKDFVSQIASRFLPVFKAGTGDISVGSSRSQESDKVGEHHILKRITEKKTIRVYLDDLDRGWEASDADRKRLAALIIALGDLTADISGLKIRISLRTDVYSIIRSTKEFTDKFESAEVWCNWDNASILKALIKRVYAYFDQEVDEEYINSKSQPEIFGLLSALFEQRFENTKTWSGVPTYRVLMSLIRRRPRDLVKLLSMAAKEAHEESANRITGKHFSRVFDDYSEGRMTDIINEFSSELSNVGNLLYNMGPTIDEIKSKRENRYVFTTEELYAKIKNVMGNVGRLHIKGVKGVTDFHEVAHFLFKIGFITARKDLAKNIHRTYYENKKQLLTRQVGDKGYSWEIHPAYRSALYIKNKFDQDWQSSVTVNTEEIEDRS